MPKKTKLSRDFMVDGSVRRDMGASARAKAELEAQDKAELEPENDPGIIPCGITLDFSVVVSATLGDVPQLEAFLRATVLDVVAKLAAFKMRAYIRKTDVHPITQEELLSVIPRKVHFEHDGRQVCATAFVSLKNLTTDPSLVTCKLCRKLKGLSDNVPPTQKEGAAAKHYEILSGYVPDLVMGCTVGEAGKADVRVEEPRVTFREADPKDCKSCKETGRSV